MPDIALQASAATCALVYLSLPPDGNGSNVNQTGWYDIYSMDFFDIAHTAVAGVQNDTATGGTPLGGWDPITGLGTPNVTLLIPDLVDAA